MGNRLLTIQGTSLEGTTAASYANYVEFYSQVATTLQSFATDGTTIQDWLVENPTLLAALHPTDLNVVVYCSPTNNFTNPITYASDMADFVTLVTATRAYGDSNGLALRIIAETLMASTNASQLVYRPTYSTNVKALIGTYLDAVIDYGIDAILGPDACATDTLLFGDGTHPTIKGKANKSRVQTFVLDTFINVTTGARRFRTA